jgi:hypothetical protein
VLAVVAHTPQPQSSTPIPPSTTMAALSPALDGGSDTADITSCSDVLAGRGGTGGDSNVKLLWKDIATYMPQR